MTKPTQEWLEKWSSLRFRFSRGLRMRADFKYTADVQELNP